MVLGKLLQQIHDGAFLHCDNIGEDRVCDVVAFGWSPLCRPVVLGTLRRESCMRAEECARTRSTYGRQRARRFPRACARRVLLVISNQQKNTPIGWFKTSVPTQFNQVDPCQSIWRFISLNEIGVAAPSSSTLAQPGWTTAPSVGVTTMPGLLLCSLPAAEVSKIVVTVVPGGGVGMRLCCRKMSRDSGASSCPYSAASCHHVKASEKSCGTPSPL